MKKETIGPNGEATIYLGDNRETLRTLPDESVQCVVTSPPYWGLRDYGTPNWMGGDPNCDHKHYAGASASSGLNGSLAHKDGRVYTPFRDVCGKCGAQRKDNQIGLEPTPDGYVAQMVGVFREVRRVLRDDGVLWLNLGDSYASGKQLVGIPWRVAFALQAEGWCLRQDVIWHKPNPMPESVADRCTKAHEYVFLLTKSARYYYDAEAVKEETSEKTSWTYPHTNGKAERGHAGVNSPKSTIRVEPEDGRRNRRSVWTVSTQPYSGAHFATFPPKLIEPMILAGSRPGDTVLDPFGGSGTTAGVALEHGRKAILCELSEDYSELIPNRINSITDALRQVRLFEGVTL